MLLRLGTLPADGEIAIVDAAVIDLAKIGAFNLENSGFGRDGDVRELDQGLAVVDDCRLADGELVIMFLNRGYGVFGVGEHPPDADAMGGELTIHAGDFGDIAVADGAIGGGEDQHDNASARPGKLMDRLPVKVESVGIDRMTGETSRCQDRQQQKDAEWGRTHGWTAIESAGILAEWIAGGRGEVAGGVVAAGKLALSFCEREFIVGSGITSSKKTALTFQELLFRLQGFWAERGCVLQQPYDVEVGAGTMAPETFLRVLGPKPYKVGYAQPSRRPADGRYGENPNRLFKHTQFQLILKPPPANVQELYLQSLEAIGIDLSKHDIKFEEDNWEWPAGGAWGVGWQVMLDGLEITQFTYFQQCGGMDLDPICAELTYGLERITQFLQDADSIYDIVWARDPETGAEMTYGEVRLAEELQFSVYNFEEAEVPKLWEHFRLYEAEAHDLLKRANELMASEGATAVEKKRFPLLPTYELALKCSNLFNILDARGAISVTERVGVIGRIRALAVGVAKAYAVQQAATS